MGPGAAGHRSMRDAERASDGRSMVPGIKSPLLV
jgi:hypothetical protein